MPAGSTYSTVATTTLGSATASYTFSSIPSTYTDLILIINGSTSVGGTTLFRFNSDSGSNYSFTGLNGDGSSMSTFRVSNNSSMGLGEMYNFNCTLISHIQNYSNTTTYKTAINRASSTPNYTQYNVGQWRNTAAVNSISLIRSSGNFNTGTTFSLYGITAA